MHFASAAAAMSALVGCGAVQPRQALPEVAAQVSERTGARVVWNQGTAADAQTQAAIDGLLAGPLSPDSAVQIALLSNPGAQASYESLGIAQGELVQAGLLSNPVFSALLRFPDGGRGNANVELSVSQNFIELISLPMRKRVAAATFESEKARVGSQIVALAAAVHEAYFSLQASRQTVELRRAAAKAMDASAQAAAQLHDAGNINDLALFGEQASSAQTSIALQAAELREVKDQERLRNLLGLSDAAPLNLPARLPEPLPDNPTSAQLEALALRQRLDFAAAAAELSATAASYNVARQFSWLSDADLTIDGEHEPDGGWVTGPGIAIPVPIFDSGAAAVAVARGQVRMQTQKLIAMRQRIISDTRTALGEMSEARTRADLIQKTLLPLREKITRQTQLQFNGMLASVFQLLQAKRDEIDAGRDYIDAVRDYWLARTELERAVGGRLPAAASAPAAAATQRSINPSTK